MDIEKFDKLPIKESMRGTWRRYGYDVDHYDNGIQNYKIVGRYIENYLKKSVGKNFDKVKKHILEHMKYHNLSNASKNIVENILSWKIDRDNWSEFTIDSQNRVQINKERAANRKKWADRRKEKRTTVILNDSRTYKLNPDLTEKQKTYLEICLLENNIPLGDWFVNLLCGGSITGTEYYDRLGIPQEGDKWWDYRYKNLKHRDFIEFCFVIDKDVEKYVYDERTKEGKRWKAEKKHAQSKKEREIEKEHKLKYETLLHDIEAEKKYKERAKDIVDRDRHGFDENSFIGEPYHGQKRKKV